MTKLKTELKIEAAKYATPEDFKQGNYAKYSITKGKGYLKEFFPSHTHTRPAYTNPDNRIVATDPDAELRIALDDYVVILRQKREVLKKQKTKSNSIQITTVILALENLLHKH